MNRIKSFLAGIMTLYHRLPFNRRMNINSFVYDGDLSPEDDINRKYQFSGDLARIYSSMQGFLVHKWHHYIPITISIWEDTGANLSDFWKSEFTKVEA